MTANTLNNTIYNNVAANTVNNAVIDAAAILAWYQNIKAVVDQHAPEIDGKVNKSGGDTMTGNLTILNNFFVRNSGFGGIRIEATTAGTDPTLELVAAGGTWANHNDDDSSNQWQLRWNNSSRLLLDTSGNMTLIGDRITILGRGLIVGSGSPEGTVTASIGMIYARSNGGAGTTLYIKETGMGNTGWVAK